MASVTGTLTALRSNFAGQPWHGSAFRKLLDGIDDPAAHARPIPKSRTIAELLAHACAWIEIVDRRLRGEVFDVTAALDFPDTTGVRWDDLLRRTEAAHHHLIETVAGLTDDDLARNVAGKPYSIQFMLSGLMHHNTYHGAQIAILKKAL